LSLAEIDKAVIEIYPHLAKDKPAIMRAYKAADTSQVRIQISFLYSHLHFEA
jgi:hypothetical protein